MTVGVRGALSLPELVVFDLAGTTVHDDGQVTAAFTAALAEHGAELAPEKLSRLRGASKRQAIFELLPDGPDRTRRAETAYETFSARLAELYRADGASEIPGARAVFDALGARGVRVALDTGFDRAITRLLLESLRWQQGVVDAVVCGDDVAYGRPAPDLIRAAMAATGVVDPARVAHVGDTALDLEAGERAGVHWNVGVLSGAHDRATLERAPHTHLIGSVAELSSVWPELAGGS